MVTHYIGADVDSKMTNLAVEKNGKFVKAWGKLGIEPGQFSLPHSVVADSKGRLYVADRNNARIQVFEGDGTFVDEWRNIVVPCSLCMTKNDELWVCGTSPMTWRAIDNMLGYPPKDQLLMKFNTSGKLLQLWSSPVGYTTNDPPGTLNWTHGLTVDSAGNVYVVEVKGNRVQKFTLMNPDPKEVVDFARKQYEKMYPPAAKP